MARLNPEQIAGYAYHAGLQDVERLAIATAIAMAESGGVTDVKGDKGITTATWGPSVGVWQIRSLNAQRGTGGPRDELANTNPMHNARAMMSISGGGRNWCPWTVYERSCSKDHTGAYKPNLPRARQAAVQAINTKANYVNPGATPAPGEGGFWSDVAETGGKVAGAPGDAAGAVVDAAGNVLGGLEAIGAFFGSLLQWSTWLRVLQIVAGALLFGAGLFLLSRDLVSDTVTKAAGALRPAPSAA
jgi:hypothetical protein